MPKRRSLVGTAREAIGAPRETPPESSTPRTKGAHRPAKPRKAAGREASPAARPHPASAPEPGSSERAPAATPANAYEAMAGFASATLRQNLEMSARLARCKSPMEAFAAQTAHAAALTQTFIAVSLQLMRLGFSTANWASLKGPATRAEPR